jgi:uncharacterized protein
LHDAHHRRLHMPPPTPPPPRSTHEFSFPVHDLDVSGKRFRLPVRSTWLRGVLEGTEIGASERDGELDLRLSRSGPDVVVRGTLAAELLVQCSRCLERVVVPVREELSALAVPAAEARHPQKGDDDDEEVELAAEDADMIAYEGDAVVLDDLVRDELLLGIPMIPLCSEGCPGIRPEEAGGDAVASLDPRLRPLLALKSKL